MRLFIVTWAGMIDGKDPETHSKFSPEDIYRAHGSHRKLKGRTENRVNIPMALWYLGKQSLFAERACISIKHIT